MSRTPRRCAQVLSTRRLNILTLRVRRREISVGEIEKIGFDQLDGGTPNCRPTAVSCLLANELGNKARSANTQKNRSLNAS